MVPFFAACRTGGAIGGGTSVVAAAGFGTVVGGGVVDGAFGSGNAPLTNVAKQSLPGRYKRAGGRVGAGGGGQSWFG